jgi:HEAT repeat protein
MQMGLNYRRVSVLSMAAMLICPGALPASDRPPLPVRASVLTSPTADDLDVLFAALQGSGCRPKHSGVGDAIVSLGSKSVPRLVSRLESTTKWWIQLEAVHLLGLIGSDAKKAIPVLDKFIAEKHHMLPKKFAVVAVAAIRKDVDGLADIVTSRGSGATQFAIELLGRIGPKAKAAVPVIEEYIANRIHESVARTSAITALKAITSRVSR